jgi:hypothetical protein
MSLALVHQTRLFQSHKDGEPLLMSAEFGLRKDGRPRKRKPYGQGRDPLAAGRVPATVFELIQAKAAARKIAISAIVREALAQYVERDRAA